jgi:hypothetical protein
VNGPVPFTPTLKLTTVPGRFVRLAGWLVMTGCACRFKPHQTKTLAAKMSGFDNDLFVFISIGSPAETISIFTLNFQIQFAS